MNNYYDFLHLLTKEEGLSQRLSQQLMELDQDPVAFYAKAENSELDQRGMPDHAPLYHCLDVLAEHNFVYETDWKADADELNYAIQQLSKGRITEDLMTEEDEEDADGMFELIDEAQSVLEELGFALLEFPHHGDAHAIALVTLDDLEALEAHMPF